MAIRPLSFYGITPDNELFNKPIPHTRHPYIANLMRQTNDYLEPYQPSMCCQFNDNIYYLMLGDIKIELVGTRYCMKNIKVLYKGVAQRQYLKETGAHVGKFDDFAYALEFGLHLLFEYAGVVPKESVNTP